MGSGVGPERPLWTVQNLAQIGEDGGVREQRPGQLPARSVGQGEDPSGSPAAYLLDGLDLWPEHPLHSSVEGPRELCAGDVDPNAVVVPWAQPPDEPGEGAAEGQACDRPRRG